LMPQATPGPDLSKFFMDMAVFAVVASRLTNPGLC